MFMREVVEMPSLLLSKIIRDICSFGVREICFTKKLLMKESIWHIIYLEIYINGYITKKEEADAT